MKYVAAENNQALRIEASDVSAKLGVFKRADDRVYNLAGRGVPQIGPLPNRMGNINCISIIHTCIDNLDNKLIPSEKN
jgi:hypothetical protein